MVAVVDLAATSVAVAEATVGKIIFTALKKGTIGSLFLCPIAN
jgi:uncharacterized MnhB-related membrane protein